MVGASFLVLLAIVAATHGTFVPVNSCSESHLMKLRQHMKNIRCKPLPSIVRLPRSAHPHAQSMSPSHVKVNRCTGAQSGLLACMPRHTKMVPVEVMLHGSMSEKCGTMEVEEHMSCQYQCAVREEHCNDQQVYLETECRCHCMDEVKKAMCETQPDREWNHRTCECQCKNAPRECTTGLLWVPALCKCRVVMMEGNDVMM